MLTARIIEEIADQVGLERTRIDRNEFWFILTFGPLSKRQAIEIDPEMNEHALRAKLEAAKGHSTPAAPAPPSAADLPAGDPPKPKRKPKTANAGP